MNLLTDAIHAFTDKEKTYKLVLCTKTNEENKTIQIEVSDTGEGISKENLEKIFQPFFTTKGKKGSGLGLFVAYGIIQRDKGKIEVKSELGEGTTFLITLSVEPDERIPFSEFPYRT